MAKWPDIYVNSKGAKKRGGAGSYRKVSILAKSETPCGREFKRNTRVDPSEEKSAMANLRSEIDTDVRLHMAVCNKSQCVARRG